MSAISFLGIKKIGFAAVVAVAAAVLGWAEYKWKKGRATNDRDHHR